MILTTCCLLSNVEVYVANGFCPAYERRGWRCDTQVSACCLLRLVSNGARLNPHKPILCPIKLTQRFQHLVTALTTVAQLGLFDSLQFATVAVA